MLSKFQKLLLLQILLGKPFLTAQNSVFGARDISKFAVSGLLSRLSIEGLIGLKGVQTSEGSHWRPAWTEPMQFECSWNATGARNFAA